MHDTPPTCYFKPLDYLEFLEALENLESLGSREYLVLKAPESSFILLEVSLSAGTEVEIDTSYLFGIGLHLQIFDMIIAKRVGFDEKAEAVQHLVLMLQVDDMDCIIDVVAVTARNDGIEQGILLVVPQRVAYRIL